MLVNLNPINHRLITLIQLVNLKSSMPFSFLEQRSILCQCFLVDKVATPIIQGSDSKRHLLWQHCISVSGIKQKLSLIAILQIERISSVLVSIHINQHTVHPPTWTGQKEVQKRDSSGIWPFPGITMYAIPCSPKSSISGSVRFAI